MKLSEISLPQALCLIAVLSSALAIYRLWFAPLSKFPGPRRTALTRLWIIYHEFRGTRTVVLDKLHAKYGPVVRVAPNEVSFNDAQGLKDIYGIKSDMGKSDFYDMFVYYNERNTFTSPSKSEHSARKRIVADNYSKSFVTQPAVAEEVRRHAARMMKIISENPLLDVYQYLHYFAMDAITHHVFGKHGTDTLIDPAHRGLVYDLAGQKHRTKLYMIYYCGPLMNLGAFFQSSWRKIRGMNSEFHVRGGALNTFGIESVVKCRETMTKESSTITADKMLKKVPDNDNQVAAECMDHLVAGVDTTGDAMCVLMWKISTPECSYVQDKLYEELQTIKDRFDPSNMTASIADLDSLPYLDAVIKEGLRWRPPVPMTLFRTVPPGGSREISGWSVPSGMTVGCQAYSLHQVPDVFENPTVFDPNRWMTEDKDKLNAMRSLFWAFSSGSRHCLGHNIATVEMKLIIASVYMYYKTRPAAGCTAESMEMDDQLTSGVPYGLKCELHFERRTAE